ncbi:twin-arginine translocase subunit TatC [Candidatus Mycalebacterium sp.]
MSDDTKAPFLKHLSELRSVVLQSALVVAALFIPCYTFFRFPLLRIIVSPAVDALAGEQTLIFTKPSEGFSALVASCLFTAFVLASPFILYKTWRFIAPGLKTAEKKGLTVFVLFGTALFLSGVLFCHSVVAPRALVFLLTEHSSDFVVAMPSLGQTLSFLLTMCLGFGIVFEFPLVSFFLSRWGIVSARTMSASRKYAYVIGALASAVITPTTDPTSMMFLFLPIVIFYEAGIFVARLAERK